MVRPMAGNVMPLPASGKRSSHSWNPALPLEANKRTPRAPTRDIQTRWKHPSMPQASTPNQGDVTTRGNNIGSHSLLDHLTSDFWIWSEREGGPIDLRSTENLGVPHPLEPARWRCLRRHGRRCLDAGASTVDHGNRANWANPLTECDNTQRVKG